MATGAVLGRTSNGIARFRVFTLPLGTMRRRRKIRHDNYTHYCFPAERGGYLTLMLVAAEQFGKAALDHGLRRN